LNSSDHTTISNEGQEKQPSHRVSDKGEGDDAEWLELGPVWPYKNGKGCVVVLKAMPLPQVF
jgi:hypothetical protein